MTISVVQIKDAPATDHTETTSNKMTLTLDSTPVAGNVVISGGYATDVGAAFTPLNGYVTDRAYAGTHAIGKVGIFSKQAGASEPKTPEVTLNTSQPWAYGALEVSGVDVSGTIVDITGGAERATSGTSLTVPTDSAVTSGLVDVLLVASFGGSTSIPGGDITLTGWTQIQNGLEGCFAYRIVTGATGVQSAAASWGGSMFMTGVIVAYKGLGSVAIGPTMMVL